MWSLLKVRLRLTPKAKRLVWTGIFSGLVATVLVWRFWQLPSGLSEPELATIQTALHAPLRSPEFTAFLPYHMLLKIVLRLNSNVEVVRAISLILSCAGLVVFYRLAREWWSRLIAGATTIMLGTSYWFLLLSRLISPQSGSLLYLSILILLFLRLKHELKWWQVVMTGLIAGAAVYQPPLMAWVAVCLTGTAFVHSLRTNRGRILASWATFFAGFFVALVPLIVVSLQEPQALRQAFGLIEMQIPADMLRSALRLARTLLWDGGAMPLLLPHIGLIDFASLVLVLLGTMRTLATWHVQRSQLILLVLGIAVGVSVLSSHHYAALGYLLPVVFLLVARGLNQFVSEWGKRFPRNPSAKLASLSAVVILVAFVAVYNLRSYYAAWARNTTVQEQFTSTNLLQ